jgi:hypothetical protein
VTPRARAAAIVAPSAAETAQRTAAELPPVSAPVESVRPVMASPQQAQVVQEPPRSDPPPPAPATRPPVQRAMAPATAPDGPPPVGATARCKDGTYLFVPATEQSCGDRGGLAVTFAPRPAPPPPPRRP